MLTQEIEKCQLSVALFGVGYYFQNNQGDVGSILTQIEINIGRMRKSFGKGLIARWAR
jgi:hypothetical protein